MIDINSAFTRLSADTVKETFIMEGRMAILQSEHLSFEFIYTGFEYGCVQYQFCFKWKNHSMIKESLLKKNNEYWTNRIDGSFISNEDRKDTFVPFIKAVLENDKADYWEPIDPDILVAIYPDSYFPFLKSHFKLVHESEALKSKRIAREALKKQKGKLPDDIFTFIVFVDAYNFDGADAYYGEGLSLHLIPTRQQLETFVTDLEKEYQILKTKFDIDNYQESIVHYVDSHAKVSSV